MLYLECLHNVPLGWSQTACTLRTVSSCSDSFYEWHWKSARRSSCLAWTTLFPKVDQGQETDSSVWESNKKETKCNYLPPSTPDWAMSSKRHLCDILYRTPPFARLRPPQPQQKDAVGCKYLALGGWTEVFITTNFKPEVSHVIFQSHKYLGKKIHHTVNPPLFPPRTSELSVK